MAKQKSPSVEKPPEAATRRAPEAPAPVSGDGYTVLARRYRPLTFVDLVGQEPVARALGNALKANRVAHAYLFTGARGVGKTSTARILAKALNCVQGPTPTPCGTCEACLSIATGEDVDVLEIDGASNRRIDEIRDIRNNVQYRPSRSRYKIYIIDEVHMLTKEAFNALLKTLEEPPPHVKFIFATTEVDKVPITILSRCQRFDFSGIALPRIVERLRTIVERENLKADPDALELIARRAAGSMRDAQSLLDQLLAFGGDRLTADQVHALLGTAGDERILGLAGAVVAGDAKKILDLFDEAAVSGLQLGELVDQLMSYWRDLMVVSCGGVEGRDLSVASRHHETLKKHAKALSLDAILAGLDVLSTTKLRMRGTNHARTLVEMALVRLTRLHELVSLSQLARAVQQGGAVVVGKTTAPTAPSVARVTAPAEAIKKNALSPLAEPMASPLAVASSGPVALTAETWPVVRQRLAGVMGGILATELAKANPPAILVPNTLVFRFPEMYNQARESIERPERLGRVEEALQRVTGQTWTVRVETDRTEPTAGAAPPVSSATPAVRPRSHGKEKEDAARIPLVKRALEVLRATIQRVDVEFGEVASADARRTGGVEE